MAENDIYNSERKYLRWKANLQKLLTPALDGKRKYWVKNPDNLVFFEKLYARCEANDISYVRRLRLINVLLFVCHFTSLRLDELDREHIDEIMAFAHKVYKTYESKRTFNMCIRGIWKLILPERDERGRIDETLMPYAVRHIRTKPDRSKKKLPQDRLSKDEVQQVLNLFYDRPDIQCAIMLAYEGLARPQEILGRKLYDVEMHERYAKVWISEHGKEGTGFIQVIDGFPYLKAWMQQHPLKGSHEAPLFPWYSRSKGYKRLVPSQINKLIQMRMRAAGFEKTITMYSFKRNGVTHMRLDGMSDNQIQRRARWTSTEQLQTYDMGNQEDAFRVELEHRGILERAPSPCVQVPPPKPANATPAFCTNCGSPLAPEAKFCGRCGVAMNVIPISQASVVASTYLK